ncbi:hypothetical protein ACHAW6_001703 [Cyclotella cf. meneghiniana]
MPSSSTPNSSSKHLPFAASTPISKMALPKEQLQTSLSQRGSSSCMPKRDGLSASILHCGHMQ